MCLPGIEVLSGKTFDIPGYAYRLRRLRAEIALAEGDSEQAFAEIKATRPPNLWIQWPECQVRIAVHARQTELAATALRNLFANPGSFWLFADMSGPGFMREAIRLAPRAGLLPGAAASLDLFLHQP
jgi:hypothetical protein